MRRLPRLGKIRLGIKLVKQTPTGPVEYPKEVDHFVVPPEVAQVYGEKPKALDVMFPPADETRFFPQQYKAYVHQGLRCRGDGERALRRAADLVWTRKRDGKVLDDARGRIVGLDGREPPKFEPNDLVEISCPCDLLEQGVCRQQGTLFVMLPKVSMGGVYQISTGSFHNIVAMNSIVDQLKLFPPPFNRVILIPFVLAREPEEIEYEGKKSTHWLLKPRLPYTLEEMIKIQQSAQLLFAPTERLALPVPVDDGPDDAPGAVTLQEEEPAPAPATDAPAPAPPEAAPPPAQPQVHHPPTRWELNLLEELGKTVTVTGLDKLWDRHLRTIEEKPQPVQERIRKAFETRGAAIRERGDKPPAKDKKGGGGQGAML